VRRALLGLVALIPAALNVAPAAAHGLAVPLCTGDGAARQVTVPQLRPIARVGLERRRRARQHAEEVRKLPCC